MCSRAIIAQMLEFDVAIVSLAVSLKGSVFGLLNSNFKELWTKNIRFKIDICFGYVGMEIKLATVSKFAAS